MGKFDFFPWMGETPVPLVVKKKPDPQDCMFNFVQLTSSTINSSIWKNNYTPPDTFPIFGPHLVPQHCGKNKTKKTKKQKSK